MEHRGNEARGQIEDDGRRQDPGRLGVASASLRPGEDDWFAKAAGRSTRAQGSPSKRDVPSWVSWQSALYIFVLGWICLLLVPLTSFWWLALVCGTAVPIALAMLDRPDLTSKKRPEDRKVKEQELLEALAARGELAPTTVAMRTSLTIDEASKMLEELARKGHLKLRVEDGIMAYALRERDRHETPSKVSAPLEAESKSGGAPLRIGAPQQLDDPLSERELEVLNLLASGRTNSEIARDLFISVGTIKSHTGNIYRKLDVKNRAEALARAREVKMIQ